MNSPSCSKKKTLFFWHNSMTLFYWFMCILLSLTIVDYVHVRVAHGNNGGQIAYDYLKGLGPILFNGCLRNAISDDKVVNPSCRSLKKVLMGVGACSDALNGTNFIGVGFDGRGRYSSESRKKSLIQRKCLKKRYYHNRQMPDVMNCFGIYDTRVHTQTFTSSEDYMSYIRKRAGVANTKSMFKAEAESMSRSEGGGGDLGAIGALAGAALGAYAGGGAGAKMGAAVGQSIGSSIGFQASSSNGNQKVNKNSSGNKDSQETASLDKTNRQTSSFFAMLTVDVVLYELSLDEVTPNDLSLAFMKDYMALPSSYLSINAPTRFQNFLLRWGTHYIRSAKMGGQLKIVKTSKPTKKMTVTEFSKIAETEFQAMFSNLESHYSQKSFGFKFLGLGAEFKVAKQKAKLESGNSAGKTSSREDTKKNMMQMSEFTETTVEAHGGNPEIGRAITDFYTPAFRETFHFWLKSIPKYAKPVDFTLRSISELMNMNMEALFPDGTDDAHLNFGCLGKKKGVTVLTEPKTNRTFYHAEVADVDGNKNLTKKIYCRYSTIEDFKEKFRRQHLALEKAVSVYMAEGPFPTTSFDIQGGKPGCETQTLSPRKAQIQPSWTDMRSKRFHVIFDMPEDIPFVARKDQEFTVVFLYNKWFALKPGTEVIHIYGGCSAANASANSKKICIRNILLTYNEKSGFFNVQPEDFKLAKAINSGLPNWLNGATVARAEVFSLLKYASRKDFQGATLAVPCSVRWINSHRIDPTQKHTCIHFSAATEGDIFVIFSAIPREKSTWYYLHMSPKGVAFYKSMTLAKTDYGYGLGTIGDKNLFESYFVCLIQSGNEIDIQYGKADPESKVGNVYAAFDFPEGKTKPSLSFYSFGVGNKPVYFNDVRLTKKLPRINCSGSDYTKVDGRCKLICHKECLKCRKANSHKHCVECKNMKLINEHGSLDCFKQCPPGSYKSDVNAKSCTLCPSGFYAQHWGAKVCSKCSKWHYTRFRRGYKSCVWKCSHYDFHPDDKSRKCYSKKPIAGGKKVTWAHARDLCKKVGGRLPEVRNDDVFKYFKYRIPTINNGYYWLGGQRKTKNGPFYWISDMKKIRNSHWHTGEPNNAYEREDVMVATAFSPHKGEWHDDWQMKKHFAICERNLD